MMKRFVGFVAVGILFITGSYAASQGDSTILQPKPIYGKQAKVIAYVLDGNHYSKIKLNDSLSSAILDSYLLNLDNSKTYFLASDIQSFQRFRTKLDDLTREENVDPAFEIYNIFKKRFYERMDYVMKTLIKKDFDYTVDEYYDTNRDKATWAKSTAELNEVWEKIIKSQALSLRLTGKSKAEIEDALEKRYSRFVKSMEQTNSEDVFSVYMNTVAEAYDPHTNYFSPKSAELFRQNISQSLEGIGARLQLENDYTKVVEILPGGPAEKTKLVNVNDRIIGVAQGEDGEMVDVIGWRLDEVVKLIKGPKGTKVRLQILPAETGVNGPASTVMLTRDKIKLEDLTAKKKTVEYTQNGKQMKLGVITLPSFYMDFEAYQKGDPNYNSTTRDVKKFIIELEKDGVSGIVLDLRNNGGGSLAEAIDLTGLFIKSGPVVQVKNSANRIEVGTDDDPSVVYNGPLVVLINRFSASASEILAGAIQDYNRGIVVGESTYGKGTVQSVLDLKRFINEPGEEVGELKLTLQKFYRVTGSSTQHRGVIPDIQLPTALDPEQYGESSQPNALPWDEIRGTLYQKTPIVNQKLLAGLNQSYQERLKRDPTLSRFVNETEEIRKSLSETRISLNEEKRKKEMEEAEKKRAANNKLGGTSIPREGQPTADILNLDDEYLREGLLVLSDLIISKIG
jgi:carboxyl-terminal processing protease